MDLSLSTVAQQHFEANIIFKAWNNETPAHQFVSNFSSTIAQQGCNQSGNFSMIVHGLNENINAPWLMILILKVLRHRGGCVFLMDYSKYANVSLYFNPISAVLLKKVKQIGNYNRQYLSGFNFGSRLVADVGKKLGSQTVWRMDLCDSSGFVNLEDLKSISKNATCFNEKCPHFYYSSVTKDSTPNHPHEDSISSQILQNSEHIFKAVNSVLAIASGLLVSASSAEQYIKFYLWNNRSIPSQHIVSNFSTSIAEQGCDPNGDFAMVVHGFKEGIATPWVATTVSRLLEHRGGCVFFMDYSIYSNVNNYFRLTSYFKAISAVLLKKVKQIGNYDRQYFFGFSFGSRLCIDAGIQLGKGLLGRMDLCDPAGPGFDNNVDPKPAAKNVACISTSSDKGTAIYNCHQNFRMGNCGSSQAGAGKYPLGSHGLCPYFYNLAFTNHFVPNNYYRCSSKRMIQSNSSQIKMGYTSNFNRTAFVGDVFIATAKNDPYVVENNVIDNHVRSISCEFV